MNLRSPWISQIRMAPLTTVCYTKQVRCSFLGCVSPSLYSCLYSIGRRNAWRRILPICSISVPVDFTPHQHKHSSFYSFKAKEEISCFWLEVFEDGLSHILVALSLQLSAVYSFRAKSLGGRAVFFCEDCGGDCLYVPINILHTWHMLLSTENDNECVPEFLPMQVSC